MVKVSALRQAPSGPTVPGGNPDWQRDLAQAAAEEIVAPYGAAIAAKESYAAAQGIGPALAAGDYGAAAKAFGMSLGAAFGALPMVPSLMGVIKAYHGGPHVFDQFKLDKIGTGEGAQAYGHGLYFAENEGVAKGYRTTLSHGTVTIDGRPVLDLAAEKHRMGLKETPSDLHEIADALSSSDGPRSARSNLMQQGPELVKKYDELVAAGRIKQSEGSLYTVDLDVEPDELLDWDKPLSEQPPRVREALETAGIAIAPPDEGKLAKLRTKLSELEAQADRSSNPDPIYRQMDRVRKQMHGAGGMAGREAYQGFGDPQAASRALREAGIPGIRYLDAGSRGRPKQGYVVVEPDGKASQPYTDFGEAQKVALSGKGSIKKVDLPDEGTRNIVVFDDSKIRITARNGQPLPTPAERAATALDALSDPNAWGP